MSVDTSIPVSGISDESFFLHILPITHIAGLIVISVFFFAGADTGMIEDFEATKLQKGFHGINPTHFLIVPRAYEVMEQKIRHEIRSKGVVVEKVFFALHSFCGALYKNFGLNLGKSLFKSVREKVFGNRLFHLASGGALCNKQNMEFFLNMGISSWANYYATTETNIPACATGVFDNYPSGTEGKAVRTDGIDVIIHAPDENGIGEVRVKTKLIMKGYFRDPELTAAAFDEDGYFKTGDLGYIDKKGYLHVTGRIKEAIMLHNGKKVAPSDIDTLYSVINTDTPIASCGVPSGDSSYDEIHLFVEKGELSEEEMQTLKQKLLDFSSNTSTLYQISAIHFIDKLPTTSVGKVKRFQLKETVLAKQTGGK